MSLRRELDRESKKENRTRKPDKDKNHSGRDHDFRNPALGNGISLPPKTGSS
jgi:hypothetical protein